ncbi:hypothetical protein V8C86DRAFT_2801788 [Haematococcus lacustris]
MRRVVLPAVLGCTCQGPLLGCPVCVVAPARALDSGHTSCTEGQDWISSRWQDRACLTKALATDAAYSHITPIEKPLLYSQQITAWP